jgi:hypothetical protein
MKELNPFWKENYLVDDHIEQQIISKVLREFDKSSVGHLSNLLGFAFFQLADQRIKQHLVFRYDHV